METQQENFKNSDLIITTSSKEFLLYTSKWANFLAILSFVGIGLMVLGGLIITVFAAGFSNVQNSEVPMGFLGIIYVMLAILYLFPTLYLYNFSKNMRKALANSNQQNLDLGFENLKSFFKFVGIFTIITISLYILIFLFAAITSIAFAG